MKRLLALLTALLLAGCDSATPPAAGHTPLLGQTRPDFRLADLDGRWHRMSDWDGKVVLVNFWASWCPPCRREMPDFVALREEYGSRGFEVVAIALEQAHTAQAYVDQLQPNFPVLIADEAGISLTRDFGNRRGALPYSVVVDRKGVVRHAEAGLFSRDEILPVIEPLLQGPHSLSQQ